jgi:putative nucleotidyltransferase with HDIG domain
MNPERCLTLARPVRPSVRRSLADHLGCRWHREATERKRVSLLEAETRRHQALGQRHEEGLHVLYGIVERLHEARPLEDSLGVALGEMSRFLGARTGSLLLLEGADRLRVLEAVGPNRERILGLEIPLEESRISRYALEEHEPILVEDMQESDRFRESEDGIRFRARSILSVPLFSQGVPLGVLNFGADARTASFTDQDRELVITLGRQVAVALEQGRLLEGLQEAVGESIRALAGAIEAKDPYTRGHSDRVTHYSRLIAEALGLHRQEVDVIVRAAILHDVGKIGVPGAVLNKPGRLTDEEFGLIRRHPEVGVEIVREIRAMEETLGIIRAHHERFDGKGYPRGIGADDIPLGARILAVVDTFDAMTSDRPYRQGLPAQVAFDEIDRCSATQFDPAVARVFLEGVPQWPDLVSPLPQAAEA